MESTNEEQRIATLRVYPGADADFSLYRDDGNTYAYEAGDFQLTQLHWSQASGKLERTGAALPAWFAARIEIIGAIRNTVR